MNKQKPNDNLEKEVELPDNLADDAPKEQTEECTADGTDNVSEELEKLKDAYVRLMAEYDNYRKRTLKEKADLIRNGGEKTLVGLLPVVDDFERAMQTLVTATEISAVKEGVELIYSKFLNYLQQNGIQAIEAQGRNFDPDLDEAIATVPAANEEQKGQIIDTVQTGYTLNDKVIRHAKVVVAN